MNRITLVVLPLLFCAATAMAQTPQSSIRESTDPARVAEVERRAQEMRSGQTPMRSDGQQSMRPPMAEGHAHGQMHGQEHRGGKRHHGKKHGHHRMHDGHPKGAPGAGR